SCASSRRCRSRRWSVHGESSSKPSAPPPDGPRVGPRTPLAADAPSAQGGTRVRRGSGSTDMPQKIVPNIWFDRNADEAGGFYSEVFRNASASVGARYPDDVPDWQSSFAGQTLTVDLHIDGYRLVLINAGDEFRPNPSISFMLNFDP